LKSFLTRTRSKDWRFSFIPQIFGTLYLWIALLTIPFSIRSFVLLVLSFTTALGFAAIGYFINEYFDKEDDKMVGKKNKLQGLGVVQTYSLLIVIITITALPWIMLPLNNITLWLIFFQLSLFLAYAAHPIRLKNNAFLAVLIDSLYAYVVPLVLSFQTFYLFVETNQSYRYLILCLAVLFLFAGIRNILVHYLSDLHLDQKINKITLPILIGIPATIRLLVRLAYCEYLIIFLLLFLSIMFPIGSIWLSFGIGIGLTTQFFFLYKVKNWRAMHFIKQPNAFYQFYFPFLSLINLIFINYRWAFWLPFHLVFLIPHHRYQPLLDWWHRINFKKLFIAIKQLLSWGINYPIFFFFLICGVNLKKRKLSAIEFLYLKFSRWFN